MAISEDHPRYFTLSSFDFCVGVYGKTKAYLFEKQIKKKKIHKAKGVGKNRRKALGQKEDLNAEDGLDHYIEMFWVILCFPNNSN